MASLAETNPYIRDPERRRRVLEENALASSAFEGARGLVSSCKPQPERVKRRSRASKKKAAKAP
jgi:hypothetical protein